MEETRRALLHEKINIMQLQLHWNTTSESTTYTQLSVLNDKE